MPAGRVLELWRWPVKSMGDERLLDPCVRCAIPTRDPDTPEKWPELLRHLDARHETLFGINARVVQAGRIAADETLSIES